MPFMYCRLVYKIYYCHLWLRTWKTTNLTVKLNKFLRFPKHDTACDVIESKNSSLAAIMFGKSPDLLRNSDNLKRLVLPYDCHMLDLVQPDATLSENCLVNEMLSNIS